ncbi:MAG: ribonuclease III family protein [Bacteriovoracia bacterium]
MSRPRLHELLLKVYEAKELLPELLTHPDFSTFCEKHGLEISPSDLIFAFTHKSFSHEFNVPHQEQLEFLGDAVLQLILTDELFERFPLEKEGHLSKLRSAIVNEKSLSTLARGLHLDDLIIVGKGEFKKELFHQDPVLADTFEALLAQIYRFHGLEFTKVLFLSWLKEFIPGAFEANFLDHFDAKSKLQEKVLARYKKLPRYSAESVGDEFEVGLWINEELSASGVFPSKKQGEKELAQLVLKKGLI